MGWFEYDYSGPEDRRSHRRGIFLRVRDFPKDPNVEELMREGERLESIEVKELRPSGNVLLEFRSRAKEDPFERCTCFELVFKEDPEWVCESDIGRGWVPGKRRK